MFPLPTFVIVFIVLFWVVIAAGVGEFVGFIFAKACGSRHRWVANIILSALGCLLGRYLGGWAWMKADNTGDPEAFLVWDRYGQLKSWRTALADGQDMLGIFGAIILVIIWNLLALVIKSFRLRTAQQRLAADRNQHVSHPLT